MRHGTFAEDRGRATVRFTLDLAVDAERVWAAVTDRSELAAWFPQTLTYRPRVGGRIDFSDDPDLPPTSGEVLAWDPPRRFAFSWGDDELWFEVADRGPAGARLTMVDVLELRDEAARNAAGWEVCLDALEAHLDGTGDGVAPHGRAAHERWRAYFAEYVAVGMPAGAPIPGDEDPADEPADGDTDDDAPGRATTA